MKYDFAIIGSGIIGLTLAFKLKQNLIILKLLFSKKNQILSLMALVEIAVFFIVEFIMNQDL